MSLDEKMGAARKAIEAGAALLALAVPTIALVRIGKLDDYLSNVAQVVLPIVGLAAIIAIMVAGRELGRLSPRVMATSILALATAGLLLSITYSWVTRELVVENVISNLDGSTTVQRVVRPLRPSQQIAAILQHHDNDYERALVEAEDPDALVTLMQEKSAGSVGIIFGTLILAQLSFVLSIVGGAWWLAERPAQSGRRRKASPLPDSRDA